jgi:hypothetical protein
MTLTPQDQVATLFLNLATELRARGATRVEAFGCVACFGPVVQPEQARTEPDGKKLGPEAKELQARAEKWFGV